MKKIQLITCDLRGLDFSKLGDLDELHLVYTIEPSELAKALDGVSVKKLILSGDVVSENKELIKSLKSKGVKIEIVGPVI